MSSTTNNLAKFITAMQRIYAFPSPNPDSTLVPSLASWVPPELPSGHRGRYLWTDAFAVLNFITLSRLTPYTEHYLLLAKTLVLTVQNVLGRTRDDSAQLPNATPEHPLAGGLRIGKEDEWGPDGDGQYHHYLTLWMVALNRLSLATQDRSYNDTAISLAKAIHPHFVYARDRARPRMYWKMSVDLSKPLVMSEGNLDPIDGLVVYRTLQDSDGETSTVVAEEIKDYEKIVRTKWRDYTSSDPLDLGMTLWTAHQMVGGPKWKEEWAEGLIHKAKRDLERIWDLGYFKRGTSRRLAFREFGAVLGIKCAGFGEEWERRADMIIDGWEKVGVVPNPDEGSQGGPNAEDDLLAITLVMYAAALEPGAFRKGFY